MSLISKKVSDSERDSLNVKSTQGSRLNGTVQENKNIFDRLVEFLINRHNGLITELTEGDGQISAAENIQSKEINGLNDPNNPQQIAKTVWSQIKALFLLLIGHVNNSENSHHVTKLQVGLGNADDTSDVNKPISTAAQAVLDVKLNATLANDFIKNVTLDKKNGTFTFYQHDGTSFSIDTVLEKVPITCRLDGTDFVLTLDDGTEQRVGLASFVDTYTFTSTNTVKFTKNGNNYIADVPDGSISRIKLDSAVFDELTMLEQSARASSESAGASKTSAAQSLTSATQKATEAQGSATTAAQKATQADSSANMAVQKAVESGQSAAAASTSAASSKSWAVGGTGSREGEDANNSKYWCEQAKAIAGEDYVTNAELDGKVMDIVSPLQTDVSTLDSEMDAAKNRITNTENDIRTISTDVDGLMTDRDRIAQEIKTASKAELVNGDLVLTVDGGVTIGTTVKFKSPCSCFQVTGGIVIDGVEYPVVDALGNKVTGIGGYWDTDCMVSVIVDKKDNELIYLSDINYGSDVRTAAFSPDGSKLVIGGWFSGFAKLYSVNGNEVTFLSNITADGNLGNVIRTASFSPDGSLLVLSGGNPVKAKLYSVGINSVTYLSEIKDEFNMGWDGGVNTATFSPDGTKLVLGGSFTAKLYSVVGNTVTHLSNIYADASGTGLDNRVVTAAFTPDGTKLVIGGDFAGCAKLYSVSGNTVTYLSDITAIGSTVNTATFLPDGSLLVLGGAFSGYAKLYSVNGNTVTYLSDIKADASGTGLDKYVNTAAFSPDGSKLVLGVSSNARSKIYTVSGNEVTYLDDIYADASGTVFSNHVYALVFSPDGRMIAICSKTAKFYNVNRSTNNAYIQNASKSMSKCVPLLLTSAQWTGADAPFTQTVDASGVTVNTDGEVYVSTEATDAQYLASCDAQLRLKGQGADSISVCAYGTKPAVDIPITLKIT